MKTEDTKSEMSGKITTLNSNPLAGTPGAHPVGTVVMGAAGGAAGGAAFGAIAGHIGAAVGMVVGAIVGGLAGNDLAETWDTKAQDADWREKNSKRSCEEKDVSSDIDGPADKLGFEGFALFPSSNYEEVEQELKRNYEQSRHDSILALEKARHAPSDA